MHVSVIGGSGFIGTRLVNRLLSYNKYKIDIIDKVPSNFHPELVKLTNVTSLSQLRDSISYDSIIINLAAEHRDDVQPKTLYEDVNVGGAINICSIAEERNINKIIFTSSVAVYGFANIGTDESGEIAPYNEYGRTKYAAEEVFKEWQSKLPSERTLVIIRPTVVFGEQNRGNVYNLFKQVASGNFIMVGKGNNRKSMAYVENVAAFIDYALDFLPGVHIYNFIDKPDFSMNFLINKLNYILGRTNKIDFRLPFFLGLIIANGFDLLAKLTGKSFAISAIRLKKFCADSSYNTAIDKTGFSSPVSLENALEQTIRYEFMESHENEVVFYSE